jgi:hypothetical protein
MRATSFAAASIACGAALPRAQEAQRIANVSVQATLTRAENTARFKRWVQSLFR